MTESSQSGLFQSRAQTFPLRADIHFLPNTSAHEHGKEKQIDCTFNCCCFPLPLPKRKTSLFLLGTGSFKGLCSRNRASCPDPLCMPSRLSSWASRCLWVSASHTAVERLGLHMLAAIISSVWAQGIQTQVLRLLASESFPYPDAAFGPNAHLVQFHIQAEHRASLPQVSCVDLDPWDLNGTRLNSKRGGLCSKNSFTPSSSLCILSCQDLQAEISILQEQICHLQFVIHSQHQNLRNIIQEVRVTRAFRR